MTRPIFAEGQILAAADLTAAVDHARGQLARHARYAHEWGIAEGLDLTTADRTDPDTGDTYVEVTLQPGVAYDGTGREVLVPAAVVLQESLFDEVNGADPATTDPYPVFLAGFDEEKSAESVADLCGSASGVNRVSETYQIIFGKLGEQQQAPEPPAVGAGPADGTEPWPILLGYVIWDGRHFARTTGHDAQGRTPPRTGVRAATVAAPTGRLDLRSHPLAEASAVVRIDDKDGLVFGTTGAAGNVTSLFSVSPDGNVSVRGTLNEAPRRGDVVVDSGMVSDGVVLPLPAGVDPERVADAGVVLHVQLRPRPSVEAGSGDGIWVDSTLECFVDADRRVHSRVRAIRLDVNPVTHRDSSVPADYLLLAVTAEPAVPVAAGGESS
ncbi:MAG: hypothetical protein ABW022_20795 [Actinoplanes sp.]